MLPPKQMVSPKQRKLLKLYDALNETDQQSVLAFAEFLSSRDSDAAPEPESIAAFPEPQHIAAGDNESVVAAIKRLSKTYHMLNKDDLLHQASSLMGGHILHGRSAEDVIAELETLFDKAYADAKREFE